MSVVQIKKDRKKSARKRNKGQEPSSGIDPSVVGLDKVDAIIQDTLIRCVSAMWLAHISGPERHRFKCPQAQVGSPSQEPSLAAQKTLCQSSSALSVKRKVTPAHKEIVFGKWSSISGRTCAICRVDPVHL